MNTYEGKRPANQNCLVKTEVKDLEQDLLVLFHFALMYLQGTECFSHVWNKIHFSNTFITCGRLLRNVFGVYISVMIRTEISGQTV